MAKKLDRRVVRTRRMLGAALTELIIEQGYESLTIQDITERADLNRATFYLHYGSKEELLYATLEEKFNQLVEQHLRNIPNQALWDDIENEIITFEHVAENAALYKVLLGDKGVGHVISRIINYIAAVSEAEILRFVPNTNELPIPPQILSQHFAGSLFALINWWLANDMPYPPEYMAKIAHEMCTDGTGKYIDPNYASRKAA